MAERADLSHLTDFTGGAQGGRPDLSHLADVGPGEDTRAPSLKEEFGRGLASGTDDIQGSLYGLAGIVGRGLGLKALGDVADAGVKRNTREAARDAPTVGSLAEIKDTGDFFRWAAGGLGQSLPSLGLSFTGAGIGAAVARRALAGTIRAGIADSAVAQMKGMSGFQAAVAKYSEGEMRSAVARVLASPEAQKRLFDAARSGAIKGAYVASAAPQAGSIQNELRARGIDAPGTALVGGAVAGLLDTLPEVKLIDTLFPGVDRKLAKGIVTDVAKAMGTQIALEGSTEGAQEMIAIASLAFNDPSFNLSDPANKQRVLDAVALGSLVGAVTGGGAQLGANAKQLAGDKISSVKRMKYVEDNLNRMRNKGTQLADFIVDSMGNVESTAKEGEVADTAIPTGSELRNQVFMELKRKVVDVLGGPRNRVIDSIAKTAAVTDGLGVDIAGANETLDAVERVAQQRLGPQIGEFMGHLNSAINKIHAETEDLPPEERSQLRAEQFARLSTIIDAFIEKRVKPIVDDADAAAGEALESKPHGDPFVRNYEDPEDPDTDLGDPNEAGFTEEIDDTETYRGTSGFATESKAQEAAERPRARFEAPAEYKEIGKRRYEKLHTFDGTETYRETSGFATESEAQSAAAQLRARSGRGETEIGVVSGPNPRTGAKEWRVFVQNPTARGTTQSNSQIEQIARMDETEFTKQRFGAQFEAPAEKENGKQKYKKLHTFGDSAIPFKTREAAVEAFGKIKTMFPDVPIDSFGIEEDMDNRGWAIAARDAGASEALQEGEHLLNAVQLAELAARKNPDPARKIKIVKPSAMWVNQTQSKGTLMDLPTLIEKTRAFLEQRYAEDDTKITRMERHQRDLLNVLGRIYAMGGHISGVPREAIAQLLPAWQVQDAEHGVAKTNRYVSRLRETQARRALSKAIGHLRMTVGVGDGLTVREVIQAAAKSRRERVQETVDKTPSGREIPRRVLTDMVEEMLSENGPLPEDLSARMTRIEKLLPRGIVNAALSWARENNALPYAALIERLYRRWNAKQLNAPLDEKLQQSMERLHNRVAESGREYAEEKRAEEEEKKREETPLMDRGPLDLSGPDVLESDRLYDPVDAQLDSEAEQRSVSERTYSSASPGGNASPATQAKLAPRNENVRVHTPKLDGAVAAAVHNFVTEVYGLFGLKDRLTVVNMYGMADMHNDPKTPQELRSLLGTAYKHYAADPVARKGFIVSGHGHSVVFLSTRVLANPEGGSAKAATRQQLFQVLAHELGHQFVFERFEVLSEPLKQKLRDAHKASGAKKTFDEWMADQMVAWLARPKKPGNFVESFFSRVIDKLKAIFKVLQKRYPLDETFDQFAAGVAMSIRGKAINEFGAHFMNAGLAGAMRDANMKPDGAVAAPKAQKVEQKPKHTMPMNYRDGVLGFGQSTPGSFRQELRARGIKSTIAAIRAGLRTATSRREHPGVKVGDLIEFTSRGEGSVLVRVTKAPYKVSEVTPEEWSQAEGWTAQYLEDNPSTKRMWQFRYELAEETRAAAPKAEQRVKLTGNSPYLAKDQAKSDKATKFIGRGSARSSTAQYAKDWGALANSGRYSANDQVFVSAEGNRSGRVLPDFAELERAAAAGATFITDDAANRSRPYNVGEREVADWLTKRGYTETKPGRWTAETRVADYGEAEIQTLREFETKAREKLKEYPQLLKAEGAIEKTYTFIRDSLFTPLASRVGKMQGDGARQLANMMRRERGNVKETPLFIDAIQLHRHRLAQTLHAILNPLSEQEREDVRREMVALNGREGTSSNPTVARLRRFFDDMHTYLTEDAGMPVAKVPNYFPKLWDPKLVENGAKEIMSYLKKKGLDDKEAAYLTAYMQRAHDDSRLSERGVSPTGEPPFAPSIKHRSMLLHDPFFDQFLQQDLTRTLERYLNSMVKRAEFNRFFGERSSDSEEWNPTKRYDEIIADIRANNGEGGVRLAKDAIDAMMGKYGADLDDTVRSTFGWVATYQNVRVAPFAVLSSFPDIVGPAVRANDTRLAWKAVRDNLTAITSESSDLRSMARTFGIISDSLNSHILTEQFDNHWMDPRARKINDKWFRAIGLESWTNFTRLAALAVGRDFIQEHAEKASRGDLRSNEMLAELGLDALAVKRWVDGGKRAWGGLGYDVKGVNSTADRKVAEALQQFVNESIMRPQAGHRPLWMSDPAWMLVSHFKSYMYTFYDTVLVQLLRNFKLANTPWEAAYALALPGAMMLALTAMGLELRELLQYKIWGRKAPTDSMGNLDYVMNLGARSGLLGPSQMLADWMDAPSRGQVPVVALSGPTLQQLMGVVTDSVGTTAMKATPGLAVLPGLRQEIRQPKQASAQ